jgi:hypothetical protein
MERTSCLNKRMYDISRYAEFVEIILIAIGIFLVPIIVPQILSAVFGATSSIATNSQYVVGTLVNSSLIIAGVNVKGWKKIVSLVTLPSLSALSSGLVLKTGSVYTLYMIPAIWLGNFAIIWLYKKLFVEKKFNYILASVAGIAAKVALIFAGYNLLVLTNIIPKGSKVATALYTAMGMNQLVTAILGSILAFAIFKTLYKKESK